MSKLTPRSWSSSTRTRRGLPESVSKYLSSIDGLECVAERFREVMIECIPGIDLVKKYDSNETLFYVDPPYLPETRNGGKAATYGVEMSVEQHVELLHALKACDGRIVLSGYGSDLYDDILHGWRKECREGKSHISNSGETRIEVLWINF